MGKGKSKRAYENGAENKKISPAGKKAGGAGWLKSKLLVCLMYVAVLSTATYAWFTLNNKPKVFNLSLTAGGAADLLIADDLGGGPGEYSEKLDLQTANQTPVAMMDMELNPVTTDNARTFYEPVYEGSSVTSVKEITDVTELNRSYVYQKTFYLKAGSIKTKSGKKVSSRVKSYDIMLLGPEQHEEFSGCVIEQKSGSSAEASAANSIRIAFIVEGQDEIPIYEPNSSQHNGGDKATNAVSYGNYKTLKQPSPGGEFADGENGNSKTLFTIREEEDVLVTMLIWIEGTDDDCTNSIQMDDIVGNIQFTSKDAEDAR
ncbi:MAG: hypothetical protein K2O16_15915 [Lachnospiraceae bacterium]|nr:hypothetical protein [Lachnospiraceae bacterium]